MPHATTFQEFRPSTFEVLHYLKEWMRKPERVDNVRRINQLFLMQPFQQTEQSLLGKIHLLNSAYHTQTPVSIVTNLLQIADLEGDLSVVNDIKETHIDGSYPFATKFCHHHNPIVYPFFSFAERDALLRINDEIEHFYEFNFMYNNYDRICDAMQAFRSHFGLETCSWFHIDLLLKGCSEEFNL